MHGNLFLWRKQKSPLKKLKKKRLKNDKYSWNGQYYYHYRSLISKQSKYFQVRSCYLVYNLTNVQKRCDARMAHLNSCDSSSEIKPTEIFTLLMFVGSVAFTCNLSQRCVQFSGAVSRLRLKFRYILLNFKLLGLRIPAIHDARPDMTHCKSNARLLITPKSRFFTHFLNPV